MRFKLAVDKIKKHNYNLLVNEEVLYFLVFFVILFSISGKGWLL